MIIRHINYIDEIKLKSTIQMIEIDPQFKFVCINVPEHYTIYLVDCNQFAHHLQLSLLHFSKHKLYSSKLAVNALDKIDTSKHNSMSGVTLLKISHIWQHKQFLAYATLQHVHIYEVLHRQEQQQKISVKYIQIIPVKIETPIIAFRFHYSALYLGHFNDDMKIYEIDSKRNLWFECDSIIKMTDQFLRIIMYDENEIENNAENFEDNNVKNTKDKKIIKRQSNNPNQSSQQEQEGQQQKSKGKNFHRYHSVNEIMKKRSLQYNDEQQNLSQPDQQPYTPVIIYQRNDNSLWKAQYDYENKKYMDIELCPSMTFECLPIADYYSDQEADDNEVVEMMVRGTEMKKKEIHERKSERYTPGKSVLKNQQKSLRKAQGKLLRKQSSNVKTLTKNPPTTSQLQQELPMDNQQQEEQPVKISDPLMYRLTQCQNYIIYDTQTVYKILSRTNNWRQIHSDLRQPCVNPFYEEIERRVYLDMWMSMDNTIYEDVLEYLGDNYEFLMIAFPDNKLYGNDQNPVQLTIVKVELLVVDKKSDSLSKQRRKNMANTVKEMNYLNGFDLDKRWDQINKFYDADMIEKIQKEMQDNKDIRFRQDNKSTQINQEEQQQQNNDDLIKNQYKTPGKEEEQIILSRYNLRSSNRSSKQKNQTISGRKTKIEETINNNNHENQEQQNNQNHSQQESQQQEENIPNGKSHKYTFPICQFEYLKSQPFRMQWISVEQLLFTNEQKRVNYLTIHPNIIYSTVYKIYLYLYWINYRDSLCPGLVASFKAIIDKFVQMEKRQIMMENQQSSSQNLQDNEQQNTFQSNSESEEEQQQTEKSTNRDESYYLTKEEKYSYPDVEI